MDIEYFNSQTAVLEQVAFEHDEEDLFAPWGSPFV